MASDHGSTEGFPSLAGQQAQLEDAFTPAHIEYQRHLFKHKKTLHFSLKCREFIKLAVILALSVFAIFLALQFMQLLPNYGTTDSESESVFLLWAHPGSAICIMMYIVLTTIAKLCAEKNQVDLLDQDDQNILRRVAAPAVRAVAN